MRARALCLTLAAILRCALAGGAFADADPVRPDPQFAPHAADGPPETVFSWREAHCADNDYPDAPFRALRLADGRVLGFSAHYDNRRLLGNDLNSLQRDCAVVFAGNGSPNPEDYSDRVWISSIWSDDGRTVFALGHDEFQAHLHPGRCRFTTYIACWWNAIVLLRSDDSGRNFVRVGERPVASLPVRQDVDQGHNRGFFEPSNIVKRDGLYFVIIHAGPEGAQRVGSCLFRTQDLSRPEAWRFFDGEAFSANVDPYRDDVSDAKPCAPLQGLKGVVGSVSYVPKWSLYIAISSFGSSGGADSGFYYSVSRDLLHWSEGRLFLALPTPWNAACGQDRFAYPSLVDPDSPSKNFDVVGDDPDLYFVRQHVDGCRGTPQRDLVRLKVRLRPN